MKQVITVFFLFLEVLLFAQETITQKCELDTLSQFTAFNELAAAKISRVKKKVKAKLSGNTFLSGRTVVYHKKKDFLVTAFSDIKDLCDNIKAVDLFFDSDHFTIRIGASDRKEIIYSKSIKNDGTKNANKFSGAIGLKLKGENSVKSCREFMKIIGFIQWDYENNDFKYLTYGVPEFISNQIEGYEIKQSFENFSSWK